MAAPQGNKNYQKGRQSSRALQRAIEIRSGKEPTETVEGFSILVEMWDKQIEQALEKSDLAALKEITDRLDGKAVAAVELTGANGNPVESKLSIEYLEAPGSSET